MRHDAMLMVRANLLDRIDAVTAQCGHARLAHLAQEIDTIRHIAHRHGLESLERLASMSESALGYHGHSAIILSYLDLMRDAVGCEEVEPDIAQTSMTAPSLRMGA